MPGKIMLADSGPLSAIIQCCFPAYPSPFPQPHWEKLPMPAQLRSRLPGPALFLALCVAPGAAMAADFFDELGAGLESIGTAITDTVKEGVQNSNALDNPTVSGRYVVPGTAGTVTCFKGATSGYILPPGATSPSAPATPRPVPRSAPPASRSTV